MNIRITFCAVALTALMGCSSDSLETANPLSAKSIVGNISKGLLGAKRKAQQPAAAPARLTKETLAQVTQKIVVITVPNLDMKTFATEASSSNGYKNYFTSGEQSFVYKNGRLAATRGLQFDLMGADTTGTKREYFYLNPENNLSTLPVTCELSKGERETIVMVGNSFSTTRYEEDCNALGRQFINKIWIDNQGQPRRSEQWIGSQMGFVRAEWVN